MIEVIYNQEEQRSNSKEIPIKLPRNIRQIGSPNPYHRIYIEDYVITYLKQPPSPDETMRVVILYGKKEMMGDELCWFVNGAVGAEKDFFMEKSTLRRSFLGSFLRFDNRISCK